MNKRQLRAMWLTIGVIIAMCLFPPSAGDFRWLWDTHRYYNGRYYSNLAVMQLLIQIFVVVLVGGGLIITLKDRHKIRESEETDTKEKPNPEEKEEG